MARKAGREVARPFLSPYVAGEWRQTGRLVTDINPSHPSEPIAEVHHADERLVREAIEAARAAFAAWSFTPAPARGEILRRAADLLEQRLDQVARDLTTEEGKTLSESTGETKRAVAILRYYGAQTLEPDGDTYPSHSRSTFLYSRREPIGVFVAITPWNFPIAIPAWKIAPALAHGNTVVWKPAELVPLTAVHLTRALVDAGLPPGVLNLVLARGSEIGDLLVTHPHVDGVTFTGSNAIGRSLQLAAVASGKKVQLEMGGKNPAVVLVDADLDLAAEEVARGAFLSAGQKCTATSRVIVEAAVLDEFTSKLLERAQTWSTGDPLDPATRIGPLASSEQFRRVTDFLRRGASDGGTFLAGGTYGDEANGYYVPATVIADINPDSVLAQEEIFGPVVVLLPARGFNDAVSLANGTPFGLTASIFTRDLSAALDFASEVRSGVVKVNQETAGLEFHVPFGGAKDSAAGPREQGHAAREFFTQWKTVYIAHARPSDSR